MEYITLDMDIADRILPSYCCISAITWVDGSMADVYSSYIYPDCDIEQFMYQRHKISQKEVELAPTMANVWAEVSNIIKDRLVFVVNGAKDIDMLLRRLDVDYLSTPNFEFASIMSICRRTWKDVSKYDFATVTAELDISKQHYNAMNDSISMGLIVNKAMEHFGVSDIEELFNKTGFAGGYVIGGNKIIYRARKDKKSKEYYKQMEIPS